MSDHGYRQYCALARALDVVGDRWTLLIVRELRPGPRRFTDLVEGLPGISRKLLTERLRDLQRDGIVTRRDLPPPSARQVYELTEEGRDLWSAIAPLTKWGVRRLEGIRPGDKLRSRWSAVAMATLADRDAARGVQEVYQYVVGNDPFHFVVDDGSIEVRDGHAPNPAVVVTTDDDTWAAIASGKTRGSAAIASGALTIEGEAGAIERLRRIFSRRHMLGRVEVA